MRTADRALLLSEPRRHLVEPARSRRRRRVHALVTAAFVMTMFAVGPSVVRPVAAAGDPVIAAAGDIACDPGDANLNGGNGTPIYCRQKDVSNLLVGQGLSAVLS